MAVQNLQLAESSTLWLQSCACPSVTSTCGKSHGPWDLCQQIPVPAHCLLLAVPLARKEPIGGDGERSYSGRSVPSENSLYTAEITVKFSRLRDVLSMLENKLISNPVLTFPLIALLSWDSWCQRDPWGLINLVWKELFELSTAVIETAVILRFWLQVLNWRSPFSAVMFNTLYIVGIIIIHIIMQLWYCHV